MIKPAEVNWEALSIKLQAQLTQERDLTERCLEKTRGLEADVDKLKIIIEYLEIKLGINNSI